MITHTIESYWIPSKKNNRSRTENVTERTRFSKSRSNDLEDIGQGHRSSRATHLLMLVIICTKIWKESIKNCRCYREDTIFKVKAEWPWRYRSRSKVITCDTSSHASDHCTKYGKNPSRTVDATERTRFSRSRPNDLEDIGQGQRSLYATHPLMLVIICAKYGKNPLRIVDFFFKVKAEKFKKFAKI